MKSESLARGDVTFVIVALGGAALALTLVARWLSGPDDAFDLTPPPARPVPAMQVTPKEPRVQTIPFEARRAILEREPDARDRCREMIGHIHAIAGADLPDVVADLDDDDDLTLCADAPLAPAFVDCVMEATDSRGLVDCTVEGLPEDQRPVFDRAAAAMSGGFDPSDDRAYERAVDEILEELAPEERAQVAALIRDSLEDEEVSRW